jgi:hypothetical protein
LCSVSRVGRRHSSSPFDGPDDVLCLLVRVEDGLAGRAADVADRQRDRQLAPLGLGQPARQHPLPNQVQLCFRDLPFHPEHQAVVEGARVVEAVLVADQGAGHGADLQELVPVGVVAGQPGALQAEHDPGPARRHLGDHLLEPFPAGGRGAGLTLVDVDHGDLVRRPAQGDRLAAQVVLADRRLGVVDDLLEAGLAGRARPGGTGGRRSPSTPRCQGASGSPSA